jgi:aminoglycoside phosphotransferase (APT) family kinase protein
LARIELPPSGSGPPPWTADHAIEPALAVALIRAQCEGAPDAPLELVGRGWDVDVYRMGDLAFRFPRRKLGITTVENEMKVLPRLAPLLPIAVPVPLHVGHATPEFPAPFYGHRFIEGITADRAGIELLTRKGLARPVAEFLRALHALDATALSVEPDTLRRDMRTVADRTVPQLERLERRALPARLSDCLARARTMLSEPPANASPGTPDHVIHGDFYARHLLLDPEGALAGVLDWGDVCHGDRAVDLAVAYTFLPPDARSEFWTAYGDLDDETRSRARHIGLCRHAISLLAYALDVEDQDLVEEASYALVAALS